MANKVVYTTFRTIYNILKDNVHVGSYSIFERIKGVKGADTHATYCLSTDIVLQNDIAPLHVASKWGRTAIVSLLIDNHANIEALTKVSVTRDVTNETDSSSFVACSCCC